MSFGSQLTKLRKRKNMTQIDLANLMDVKQYVVSSWELGRSEHNISQIIKLSDIFCVPTDYLLDKNIIRTISEDDFNKALENIDKDIKDDYLKDIKEMLDNVSDTKKAKIINIIKELSEL